MNNLSRAAFVAVAASLAGCAQVDKSRLADNASPALNTHIIENGGVELQPGIYAPVRVLDGAGGRQICKYGELSC